MSRRILIYVAYDGTDYHGFARLKDDPQTIEGKLDVALTSLLGTETEVTGTSRTDSGVHALGNAAVFDTVSSIPVGNFPDALNTKLPQDIRVRKAIEVPGDFHPRHTETIKTYRYEIDNERIADPLRARYSMLVGYDLDIGRMNEAASKLTGEHDFKSFCSVHTQAFTTVREITDIAVTRQGVQVFITVKGRGFLYNMVRIIAGTLIDAGRGRLAPGDVADILYAVDRTKNPAPTAEAKGLTLVNIDFLELEDV
ncbi:MAG: tRNA pseudouridine(38-40) synthase TruA [Lachnospiraceae bacterium]|nr:tRNA pseudouridine(38-40) synthase TruA [Lachnospiraceae bacterium]MBR1524646.1 tRNA pseudouridine(38-40) synthase TruA [Lachnospiraceae bacterium]